jgi:hypothetical protein
MKYIRKFIRNLLLFKPFKLSLFGEFKWIFFPYCYFVILDLHRPLDKVMLQKRKINLNFKEFKSGKITFLKRKDWNISIRSFYLKTNV